MSSYLFNDKYYVSVLKWQRKDFLTKKTNKKDMHIQYLIKIKDNDSIKKDFWVTLKNFIKIPIFISYTI